MNRKPGYGMLNPYFSKEVVNKKSIYNENTAYSYFIFNEPVDCSQIKIVEYTDNPFLNIAELMVFPENPIQYITKYKQALIEMDEIRIANNKPPLYNGEIKKIPIYLRAKYISRYNTLNWEDYRWILFNGNPAKNEDPPGKVKPIWTTHVANKPETQYSHLSIDMKAISHIERIIIWETNPDKLIGYYTQNNSQYYATPYMAYSSAGKLYGTPEYSEYTKNIEAAITGSLTTPFAKTIQESGEKVTMTGHAIPYAPYGIDSPRTFAYKMYQQLLARQPEANRETSNARLLDYKQNYQDGYASEIYLFQKVKNIDLIMNPETYIYDNYSVYNNNIPLTIKKGFNTITLKPYLPNLVVNNPEKTIDFSNSLYSPDKTAGVDSIGLLLGSIAMSGIKKVNNLENTDIGTRLDKYYKMIQTDIGRGMDSDGRPDYYSQNGSVKDYRITKADMEKMTILVPDISELQRGDLLVNYDDYDTPHIGIVYKILWNTKPAYGADYSDYWDKVLVISIRRGLQNAIIGYWGNKTGTFTGFTTKPWRYQIRRLLYTNVETPGKNDKIDSWEFIRGKIDRKWEKYNANDGSTGDSPIYTVAGLQEAVNKKVFPFTDYTYNASDKDYSSPQLRNYILEEQIKKMYEDDLHYLREFPPTSYYNVSDKSLFKDAGIEDNIDNFDNTGYRTLPRPYIAGRQYNIINDWILSSSSGITLTFSHPDKAMVVTENNAPVLKITNDAPNTEITGFSNSDYNECRLEAKLVTDSPISFILGYIDENNYLEAELIPKPPIDPAKPETDGVNSYLKLWKMEKGNKSIAAEFEDEIVSGEEYDFQMELNLEAEIISAAISKKYSIIMFPTLKDKNKGDYSITVATETTTNNVKTGFIFEGKAGIFKSTNGITTIRKFDFIDFVKVSLPWINYHLGTDVKQSSTEVIDVSDTGEGWDFYAPEDGEFWITNGGGFQTIPKMDIDSEKLEIIRKGNTDGLDDKIFENRYYNNNNGKIESGMIGILVTNPETPRMGRVYLFCHMGSKKDGETVLQYAAQYQTLYGDYPEEIRKRIKVKAGQWIGKVGQRGYANSPHIHLEVFEYFPKLYRGSNRLIADGDMDSDGKGWKKVNFKTSFDSSLVATTDIYLYQEDQIKNAFGTTGIYSEKLKETILQDKFIKDEFREWYYKEEK